MSNIKDMRDYFKQTQRMIDSIYSQIPKSTVEQIKSVSAASKLVNSGVSQLAGSFSSKIPESATKQFESVGFTNKQLESFNAVSNYINSNVVQSAAAVSAQISVPAIKQLEGFRSASIGFDSKLTDIFDSAAMKSIRQQQKLFDSVYSIASAVKITAVPDTYFTGSVETVSEYLDSVKGFQQIFDSLSNTTISAGLFKSSLESFSIPEPNERLASFVDSASNIIINEDSVDIPDELADTISQEKELPEGTFKDSVKKGFKRVALSVFENIIATLIVNLICVFVFPDSNALIIQTLESIQDALSDGIHEIVVEERQQTAEEKKQTLELQKQTEEEQKQTKELQKQTKEDQEQTKLLKQLVDNSSDLKER